MNMEDQGFYKMTTKSVHWLPFSVIYIIYDNIDTAYGWQKYGLQILIKVKARILLKIQVWLTIHGTYIRW